MQLRGSTRDAQHINQSSSSDPHQAVVSSTEKGSDQWAQSNEAYAAAPLSMCNMGGSFLIFVGSLGVGGLGSYESCFTGEQQ